MQRRKLHRKDFREVIAVGEGDPQQARRIPELLGAFRTLSEPLGTSWNFWGPLGTSRSLSNIWIDRRRTRAYVRRYGRGPERPFLLDLKQTNGRTSTDEVLRQPQSSMAETLHSHMFHHGPLYTHRTTKSFSSTYMLPTKICKLNTRV